MLELRYQAGIVFDAIAAVGVQVKRRELMGERPYATLTIIPEDADFNMDAMREDQAKADRWQGQLLASAIVAKSSLIERLTNVYFSYFPQLHRILVTDNEEAARTWLAQQLEEIARTGS